MGHAYSSPIIKILFATATRCAYPGCTAPLVFEDRGYRSIAVEIAHIRSARPGGPRHDPRYPREKLNTEENLLLLCASPHHRHVDKYEDAYSIEELLEWKLRQVAQGRGCEVNDKEVEPLAQKLDDLIAAIQHFERHAKGMLASAKATPLAMDEVATGEGIYALYYTGPHELYRAVSSADCLVPVYVKAVRDMRTIKEHRRAIEQCHDLDVSDFQVRHLQLEEHRAKGVELVMLDEHRPVWNTVLRGFGAHGDLGLTSMGRRRTRWDELHPGRPWAVSYVPCRDSDQQIRVAVLQHFVEFLLK